MKKVIIAAIMIFAAGNLYAQSKITSGNVTFELKNLGIKTGGKMGGLQGNITFDPSNIAAAKIEATADVNTIDTDNEGRDEHLRKEDFFNAAIYPKIIMSSTSIKKRSGNKYTGIFTLTIKGKTKLIELPFTYTGNADGGSFTGVFKINRKDFGIGGNSITMSDEVTVLVDATSSK